MGKYVWIMALVVVAVAILEVTSDEIENAENELPNAVPRGEFGEPLRVKRQYRYFGNRGYNRGNYRPYYGGYRGNQGYGGYRGGYGGYRNFASNDDDSSSSWTGAFLGDTSNSATSLG